jgi:AraC family transcriptional regulator
MFQQTFTIGRHARRIPACADTGELIAASEATEFVICEERRWRCPSGFEHGCTICDEMLISRWIDSGSSFSYQDGRLFPDRYVVSIALKNTRVCLARNLHTIFDGAMPAGTVYVTGPSPSLTARFMAPCDFIHLYVPYDFIQNRHDAMRSSGIRERRDLIDLIIRDPLTEILARTLIEGGNVGDRQYAASVGQALVMRIMGLELRQAKVRALPKWRLKHVDEYIAAHIDGSVSLADLAAASGLSKMHFAAQFRVATGYRPHEYVLLQRIAFAKRILSNEQTSIVEAALRVGFCDQAHFSTVFKRFTGETPARWRAACMDQRPDPTTIPSTRCRVAAIESRSAALA